MSGVAPDKTRESFDATLSDLSHGGLKVRCPKPVKEGMVLELSLGMPGISGLLTLNGDVRHCQEEAAGHFSVGVRFAPVSEEERKAVANLLEVLLGIAGAS